MAGNNGIFTTLLSGALATLAAAVAVEISAGAAVDVRFDVDLSKDNHLISPFIYGGNGDAVKAADGSTISRSGGNRLTGYNWENNASHAGMDWYNWNDGLMGSTAVPGKAFTDFNDGNLASGRRSIITLQAAGYVAQDKNQTPVTEAETAPSARWKKVVFEKGKPFVTAPDVNDGEVYMDELVNFLTVKYGPSSGDRGIFAYDMDNEPALWPSTHPRIHPAKAGAAEVADKNAALAKAVKAVDRSARIFGGVFYGYMEYFSMQDAPDWNALKTAGKYTWYVDYFLDRMAKASADAGVRLLDALDIHWYPEAYGDTRIVGTGVTAKDVEARVQAPRSLWDSTYKENSWITGIDNKPLNLLPRLFASINKYYPGTLLTITEYEYGAPAHISGGLATADFLGVLGRMDVFAATRWPMSEGDFTNSAYRLFRNPDGQKSAFGSLSARAVSSSVATATVYAAYEPGGTSIHLIAINKSATDAVHGTFNIASPVSITGGQTWAFDKGSAAIAAKAAITAVTANSFTFDLPAQSAYHLILKTSGTLPTAVRPVLGRAGRASQQGIFYSLDGRKLGLSGRPRAVLPVWTLSP